MHKYGLAFNEYRKSSKKNIIIIAQIEHIKLLIILRKSYHPGIDGIIVGPYDLSASMGYPGKYNRNDVLEALNKVEKTTLNSNKSLGFHVIESDHLHTLQKIKKGYTFLAFSMDFFFLGDNVRKQMNLLKKATEDK